MPKEDQAELSDLRDRALEIAEHLEAEHSPREYSDPFYVREPPASSSGSFQNHVRATLARPGEFDPTPQQKLAEALRACAAAVDFYFSSTEDLEPGQVD